jgi:hypothetical protein
MPYQTRTIKEIPNWLECPICEEYDTKQRNYLMNHFKKCEQYEGHIDDVLSYNINENTTVEDFIEQEVNAINTVKKLIKTNELQTIQNQTPDEIRLYIKTKLLQGIHPYFTVDFNAFHIYEFFFGDSEENSNKFSNEMYKYLNQRIFNFEED